MNYSFWHGRRVFVTGHTGFKGGWLSLWLQSLGAEVVGFALPPSTQPSLFEGANVSRHMNSIIGDVRDLSGLEKAIQACKPEVIIHMAAQPLVRHSYLDPVETYSTNVMGTVHLLDVVRRTPSVAVVVNVTTDKCYENREWLWGYRENEPMGGYDPYSSSKGCAELVTSAYRSSFFNPQAYAQHGVAVASARAGNVIGGGDWAHERLIPDIVAAFESGRPAIIRNPTAIRPWQHVLEPLRGYLTLAERLYTNGADFAEPWNFGPNEEDARPVGWVADQLVGMWGGAAAWRLAAGEQPHEANFLKLDISKSRSRLQWHPSLRLFDALRMVTEWSKRRCATSDMRAITLEQISAYQSLNP